jgi:hypothetical protein
MLNSPAGTKTITIPSAGRIQVEPIPGVGVGVSVGVSVRVGDGVAVGVEVDVSVAVSAEKTIPNCPASENEPQMSNALIATNVIRIRMAAAEGLFFLEEAGMCNGRNKPEIDAGSGKQIIT